MLPRTYLQSCKSSVRRIGCTQVCPACGCGRAATVQRFFLLLCDGTKRIVLILLQHVTEICSSRCVYQCSIFIPVHSSVVGGTLPFCSTQSHCTALLTSEESSSSSANFGRIPARCRATCTFSNVRSPFELRTDIFGKKKGGGA